MRKKGIVGLLILGVLGLIGVHRLEPELRVYPLAMGFDLTSEGYRVYYDIPDLSVYTGDSKPMEEEERVWSFAGTGSRDINRQILETKKETPDMGHVQAILFGKNLLMQPEKYAQVLESFVNEPMLGSGAYVFAADDLAAVMSISAAQTDSLGGYLVDLLDKTPKKRPVIMQDLYNAYYNGEMIPEMTKIEVEQQEDGTGKLVVK